MEEFREFSRGMREDWTTVSWTETDDLEVPPHHSRSGAFTMDDRKRTVVLSTVMGMSSLILSEKPQV